MRLLIKKYQINLRFLRIIWKSMKDADFRNDNFLTIQIFENDNSFDLISTFEKPWNTKPDIVDAEIDELLKKNKWAVNENGNPAYAFIRNKKINRRVTPTKRYRVTPS